MFKGFQMKWRMWITMGVTATLTWYYNGILSTSVSLPWRFFLVVLLSTLTWWSLFRVFIRQSSRPDLLHSEP